MTEPIYRVRFCGEHYYYHLFLGGQRERWERDNRSRVCDVAECDDPADYIECNDPDWAKAEAEKRQ